MTATAPYRVWEVSPGEEGCPVWQPVSLGAVVDDGEEAAARAWLLGEIHDYHRVRWELGGGPPNPPVDDADRLRWAPSPVAPHWLLFPEWHRSAGGTALLAVVAYRGATHFLVSRRAAHATDRPQVAVYVDDCAARSWHSPLDECLRTNAEVLEFVHDELARLPYVLRERSTAVAHLVGDTRVALCELQDAYESGRLHIGWVRR